MRQRGIVADWRAWGKRKVCEGSRRRSHTIHSFSTSTRIAQIVFILAIFPVFSRKFLRERQSLHKNRASVPEEKSAYCGIFLSGRSNS
jgi:hypothetical protein